MDLTSFSDIKQILRDIKNDYLLFGLLLLHLTQP
jgi:hypothetical protein